jgi:transposase-like protein
MRDPAANLDPKQEEAIVALLTQRNVEEAARAIDVGASTLFRWLKDPAFDRAYREARRLAFRQSIGRLQQGATAAATTLLKMMVDPNVPASCRIRAADSVLAHAAKAIELEDIEARVSELERAAETAKAHR